MALDAGVRLGPYEVLGPVGSGGMGEVYRARDTRLERDVAIKVLPPHLATDPMAVERFRREAQAVAALSHPNIVGIFDVGSEGATSFVVTELLTGETLRARLAAGPLAAGQALEIARQVAAGLAAAHRKGIVHRDLKPENVFVTTDGNVKLLDFGLAKRSPLGDGTPDETGTGGSGPGSHVTALAATTPGTIVGTVGYMSPEQVRGQETDARTDVFSFGSVLVEIVTGRRAFAGSTTADTMAAIVRDQPPDVSGVPGMPGELSRLIRRCLEKRPADRFDSAVALASALDAVPRGSSSGTGVGQPDPGELSLAVLPFDDLSPDRDNEFFADGLAEEVITDLSRIQGLRVISRASTMQLKGRVRDVRSIGQELNVSYLIGGSVRKAGNRLRITAQLIDAGRDTHLWSAKFDGTLDDIFDIQEKVSRAIVDELKVTLTPEESRDMAARPIGDPRAYESYLRARGQVMRFTADGLDEALREVERATELVGENVLLLAVRGDIYWQRFNLGLAADVSQLDRIEAVAQQIQGLEPGSAHAERLMAFVDVHRDRPTDGLRRLQRAVAIDPNDSFSASLFVALSGLMGKPDLARPTAERLLDRDPLQAFNHIMVGLAAYLGGDLDAALRHLERGFRMDPSNPVAGVTLGKALAAGGRREEALAVLDRIEREQPDNRATWLCQVLKWGLTGQLEPLVGHLTAERRAWSRGDPEWSLLLAEAFALTGDRDRAFEWIEAAVARGLFNHPYLSSGSPFLAALRDDPRWPPLLARVRGEWERLDR